MGVRIGLLVALLAVSCAFVLDMSGRAPRIAGTDHISPVAFVATVPSHGTLCQPEMVLPADAHTMEVLIGTYGQPVPALNVWFEDERGQTISSGRLLAGAKEGPVAIPLAHPQRVADSGTLCLRAGSVVRPIVLGGEAFTPGVSSVHVDGRPRPGRIEVIYMRAGRESWWQLLGVLDQRFGLGKAALFGDWTLPVLALGLLVLWIGVVRLLVRELT